MLPDNYTAVLQARSREDLLREVVGFTKRLGFDTVNATHKLSCVNKHHAVVKALCLGLIR